MDAVYREWCFGVRCLQQQCRITWSLGDCYPNEEVDQKSLLGLLSPLAFRFSPFACSNFYHECTILFAI